MEELIENARLFIVSYFSNTFIGITNLYFAGNLIYFSVFIFAFSLLIAKRNAFNRGSALFVSFTLLTMILFVFNPALEQLISRFPASNDQVFARVWLLCPIWLIIAFSSSFNALHKRRMITKNARTIMLSLIIIIFGNSLSYKQMYIQTNEVYKINADAVEIADKALQLSDGEPTSLYILVPSTGGPMENFVNGGTVYQGINQYTGLIDLYADSYTETDWSTYFISDMMPDGVTPTENYINYFFAYAFGTLGCEYVAFPDDSIVNKKIDHLGYSLVGEAGGYRLYSNSNMLKQNSVSG